MKHYGLFFLLLCCALGVNAQVIPIYFRGDKITTNKDDATSYAVYGKLSDQNLWVLKRYDLDDNLIQTGSYADEGLTTPHGKFIFYMDIMVFNQAHNTNFRFKDKTRFMSQVGNFINGVEQGRWVLFYPDGNVLNTQDFVDGKLNGEFVTYDKFGKIITSGHYIDGLKDGEWIFEKGEQKAIYEKGTLKSSFNVKKPNKTVRVPSEAFISQKTKNKSLNVPDPNRKHEVYQKIAIFNQANRTKYPITKEKTEYLSEQGQFVNNLEEGTWFIYYPDGKVMLSRNFLGGKLHGEAIAYDKKGVVTTKGNFVNGYRNGEWFENGRNVYYDKGELAPKPPTKP